MDTPHIDLNQFAGRNLDIAFNSMRIVHLIRVLANTLLAVENQEYLRDWIASGDFPFKCTRSSSKIYVSPGGQII
jgi:hypothetical protein